MVGEIVASSDRGDNTPGTSPAMVIGRTLLSTGDNIILRFTADLAKIKDSDTYEDNDPYFDTFPIYAVDQVVTEPDRARADSGRNIGNLLRYKGKVTVVARVEGLVPSNPGTSARAKRSSKLNQDLEPVSYVGRITYSEDAIKIGDKILYFYPADPGPERFLDSPYVENPGAYVSPGN
jgi:hypothetical protein